jgi:hypothetical protein
MKAKTVSAGIVAVALVVFFSACELSPEYSGSLILNIESRDIATQTFAPTVPMSIATYDIFGSGPGGTVFYDTGVVETVYIESSLVIGPWTVTIDGRNSDGKKIASVTEVFTITAGQTTDVAAVVVPLSGSGELIIDMSWPVGAISAPNVYATLAPVGGSASPITFTVNANTASFSDLNLNAGYYSLNIRLKDGTTVVWGLVEAVRILAGETTGATITLTQDDINPELEGSLELDIGEDLQNPIVIQFSGQQSSLPLGTDMVVVATPSVVPDSYRWYLNGSEVTGATSNSITVGSALGVGSYRLDVIIRKGNILSSEYLVFTIVGSGVEETVDFPMPGDTRVTASGSNFWNAGDYVQGTRSTGVASISAVTIHLEIGYNSLSGDTQDVAFIINGVTVGTFSVAGGNTAIDESFSFASISGPAYTLRYETTRTVTSGAGSAGYSESGSTVELRL